MPPRPWRGRFAFVCGNMAAPHLSLRTMPDSMRWRTAFARSGKEDSMSERMNWFILLVACSSTLSIGAAEAGKAGHSKVICVGRVEPVDGEVELSAQMSGTLIAVLVKEGDWVTNGMILAEVDARREKAAF